VTPIRLDWIGGDRRQEVAPRSSPRAVIVLVVVVVVVVGERDYDLHINARPADFFSPPLSLPRA